MALGFGAREKTSRERGFSTTGSGKVKRCSKMSFGLVLFFMPMEAGFNWTLFVSCLSSDLLAGLSKSFTAGLDFFGGAFGMFFFALSGC